MGFEFERDILGGKSNNEKAREAADAKQHEADKWAELQGRHSSSKYASQAPSLTGTYEQVAGRMEGLERAGQVYGMGLDEIGQSTQDIVARRRKALDGQDPATTALHQRKNEQLRQSKAGGGTDAQMAQIERLSAADIGQQEFRSQDAALDDYQRLVGNIIGGTTSLEMGMGSLGNANTDLQAPQQGSGLGTVICTELHRQGYMTSKTLRKDSAYGEFIRLSDPLVYVGYIWLAMPIVAAMKKSKLFTKIISYPALAWANDMAYDNSRTGKIINKIGQPVCRFIGSLISKLHNKGIIYV